MKLLDPKDVKEETKKADQERLQRIRKMNEEESAMVRKINNLHTGEKEEKNLITQHVVKFKADANAVISSLNKKIKGLFGEVEDLEARKAEALKPINAIKKEADERLALAQKKEDENKKEDHRLSVEADRLLDWKEELADLEGDISLRNKDSLKREERSKVEETHLKNSENKLAEKWVEFHKEVAKANKDIAKREKEVEDGKRANETFKTSLDRKEIEQAEHDRQIADRYGTLGRAIEEAREKHGVNL